MFGVDDIFDGLGRSGCVCCNGVMSDGWPVLSFEFCALQRRLGVLDIFSMAGASLVQIAREQLEHN